jgi:hypothetical protein
MRTINIGGIIFAYCKTNNCVIINEILKSISTNNNTIYDEFYLLISDDDFNYLGIYL